MQVVVLAVGSLKEKYWTEAVKEYAKRLSRYVRFDIVEVGDEPTPDSPSDAEREQVLHAEAARISKHLKDRDAIVALDIEGRQLTSEEWSQRYVGLENGSYGRVVFVIGGSLGIHEDLLKRATFRWSFGPITLPHQLARVVLLEQLYRGIRIARGEPYHK